MAAPRRRPRQQRSNINAVCHIKSLLPAEHGWFLIVKQLQEAQVEPTDGSDGFGYCFGYFAKKWTKCSCVQMDQCEIQ